MHYLSDPCFPDHDPLSTGEKMLRAIGKGRLPPGMHCWPAEKKSVKLFPPKCSVPSSHEDVFIPPPVNHVGHLRCDLYMYKRFFLIALNPLLKWIKR